MMLPIALTPGEPAGIGPDLTVQLSQFQLSHPLVIIGSADLLRERAKHLHLPLTIKPYAINEAVTLHTPASLTVLDVAIAEIPAPGKPSAKNANYVLNTLQYAVAGCLQQQFAALVTGPVHKGIINDAGINFSGHTEYLAELTKAHCPVMMLVADELRVALVTTHIPLSQVPAAITAKNLQNVIQVIHKDLQQRFHIANPHILVCGLNPHAGEGGHLGREEIEVITPVLERLRQQGVQLTGPSPADTAFTPKQLKNVDAVLAMYHDQGLPVLKYAGFNHAVNVTLGLPIIRTSVDHGTAFDVAGTGKADMGSLKAALELAINLSRTD